MHSLGLINRRHYKHHRNSNLGNITSNTSTSTLNLDLFDSVIENRKSKRLKINVSGQIYETYERTLNKYPETILGTHEKRDLLTDHKTETIFLHRHRGSFEAILFFFQSTGNLVRPENIMMSDFVKECRLYDIPEDAIKRMKHRECFLYSKIKDPKNSFMVSLRKMCWTFIENPVEFQSYSSFIYFAFSYTVVVCSIILYCLHTELILHKEHIDIDKFLYYYENIELGINTFFATELVLRFIVSPVRKDFLLEPVNFFEIISVTVFFLITTTLSARSEPGDAVLSLSRTLYTFRITRLGRVSKIVKTSFTVFQEAFDDIAAVLYTMLIIVVLSGTVMYYLELNVPNTQFTSIPESMWWAVQTSICLGYGDIVPETNSSRYIGLFVLYGGVVVVMILILSFGGRVFDMYIKEFHENCGGFLSIITEKEDYEIHY